jgi:hypothetical protein
MSSKIENKEDKIDYNIWIIPIVLVIGITIYLKIKYQSKP